MYNIVLLCQFGASTGMLVEKMRKAAEEKKVDCVINAYSFTDIAKVVDAADVILLGPQIRFNLEGYRKQYADRGVVFRTIEVTDYGRLNGSGVLDTALNALKEGEA